MAAALNAAQQRALASRMAADGATSYIADRDEEHDEHVFVSMYAGREFVAEVIIEGDGRIEG